MHILYLHQYFATPRGSTGTRSYEFARRWVKAGHQVTVLTSQAQLTPEEVALAPSTGVGSERGAPAVLRFDIEGVKVIALRVPYHQRMGKAARSLAFLRFMTAATRRAVTHPGVDVIYASSTPLTVAVPALAARGLRGRPFVFEVRDLWPDLPIAFGALRSGLLRRAARMLERRAYARARAVVALSPGAAEVIRSRSPKDRRVEVIPNCADVDVFTPDADGREIRRKHGWVDKFVLLHAGALGPANGLDAVVRTADGLRGDASVHFVLLGEGSERLRLEEETRRRGLTNVEFIRGVAKAAVPAYFAAADVALVIVAPLPIMQHNSANKFFDALSAGRPVLLNYSGWQRELLESAGAGAGCDLGDEEAFAARVRALKSDRAQLAEMGRRARQLAVEKFDRDRLAGQALRVVEEAAR
ncbi:MAG: D-inositol-3-phosphate glycosyltransferase [Phycisphaerae bacterium]|nr:D-inositol-3-phosphate glycosyltransferase [Phycisphaerae bacterium]